MAGRVAALKAGPGRRSPWSGSTRLARTLLRAGLVDELSLLLHPIVVGTGQRLFEEDGPRIELDLIESTTFSTGVVHQRYAKK